MSENELMINVAVSTLIILLLIAGIVIFYLAANKQSANQKTALTEAKLSYEQELRRTEAELSEQMMMAFARELHDNIGHILTCMRLVIENKKLDQPAFKPMIEPVEAYLDEASAQLRLLSRSLNSEYVSNVGLIDAIGIEVDRQRHLKKFVVNWKSDGGSPDLNRNQQLIVFRIIQELLQNAIRHSRATVVEIQLSNAPFELYVNDNGHGFDLTHVLASKQASGLNNILKRSELSGLMCKMESKPGHGFSCIISRPNNPVK